MDEITREEVVLKVRTEIAAQLSNSLHFDALIRQKNTLIEGKITVESGHIIPIVNPGSHFNENNNLHFAYRISGVSINNRSNNLKLENRLIGTIDEIKTEIKHVAEFPEITISRFIAIVNLSYPLS